jgi:hypothetical protein
VLKFGYPSRVPYEVITEKYAHALTPRPVNLNARNFCEAVLGRCQREPPGCVWLTLRVQWPLAWAGASTSWA